MSGYDQDYSGSLGYSPTDEVTPAPSAGVNWGGVASALQNAQKQMQGTQAPGSVAQAPLAQGQAPQAPLGHPSAPVNLGNLLQMLQQRQQTYASAAMKPGSPSPALQQARPTTYGLLGY